MTRYPAPGRVKTRLIPTLGELGAADLQRRMTEHALSTARQAAATGAGFEIEVWYDGADESQMRAWLGDEVSLRRQTTGGLGPRLRAVVAAAFDAGTKALVIVGADSPGLDRAQLAEAFERLATHDLVLGPAADGGYYLIGLGQPIPELFRGIPWSTDQVLATTLGIADELGLATAQLVTLYDVDRPEDLAHVPRELLEGIKRR
jgi:rSAM/selenodomain-associated transferase 1